MTEFRTLIKIGTLKFIILDTFFIRLGRQT